MKEVFNEFSESGFRNFRKIKIRLYLGIIILLLALSIYTGYFIFYRTKDCKDIECYNSALKKCSKVGFIKEDPSFVWSYKILRSVPGDVCEIEVTLLKIKQGDIEFEKIQGKSMTCNVFKSGLNFPEKDIENCHGLLKEELQDIVIKRMHNYLLQNIGQINEEFNDMSRTTE